MSSNPTDNQVSKRSVSFDPDTTSRTSSNTTLYAGNPTRDDHNLKRELTTSFKDSYKSLSQPKPESKAHSKPQASSKTDLEVTMDSTSNDMGLEEDREIRETSALKEVGIWAVKVFNHSMATRGLH